MVGTVGTVGGGTVGVLVVVGRLDGDTVEPDGAEVEGVAAVLLAADVVLATAVLLDAAALLAAAVEVTARTAVPTFPAASRAVTVITLAPAARTMPEALQPLVPKAVPLPPRSFVQPTCMTPTLSLAVPPMTTLVPGVVNAPAVVGL